MKILALVLLAVAQIIFWSVRLRKMQRRYEALREDWYQAVSRAERRRAELLADFPVRCPQCRHGVPKAFLEHEQLGGIFGGGTLTACRHCLYGEDYP